MMTQSQTFSISEQFLTNRRRSIIVVGAGIIILFILAGFFGSGIAIDRLIKKPFPFIILPVCILAGFFAFRRMQNHFRHMKLHLNAERLVREVGTKRQEIAWNDITRTRIRHNPRSEPHAVEIFTGSRSPLVLIGFEPMSEIIHLIQTALPATVQVETRQNRLNSENPLIAIGAITAFVLVFLAIRKYAGSMVSDNLNHLIQVLVGILFLVTNPISRINPNFRKWEIIFGILILVGALGSLIAKVMDANLIFGVTF